MGAGADIMTPQPMATTDRLDRERSHCAGCCDPSVGMGTHRFAQQIRATGIATPKWMDSQVIPGAGGR
jgi:hypothetical protein